MISMLTIHQTFVESMQWWKLSSNQMVVNILHGSFEVRVMNSIQCRKCWFWRINKEISYLYDPAAIFLTPFHVAPLQDPQLCCEGQWLAKTLRTKGQKIVSYEINATHDHYRCVKEFKSHIEPYKAIISKNRYKQAHMIKPMKTSNQEERQVQKGWLAITRLKPLSLFISLSLMLKKAFDNVKI